MHWRGDVGNMPRVFSLCRELPLVQRYTLRDVSLGCWGANASKLFQDIVRTTLLVDQSFMSSLSLSVPEPVRVDGSLTICQAGGGHGRLEDGVHTFGER